MIKRAGKADTQMVKNRYVAEIPPILQAHADRSPFYSDGFTDLGYKRRYRVHHGRGELACGHRHINGIECFRGFAKSRLARFRGMSKRTFYRHLKGCEFRFNHRHDETHEIPLKSYRKSPLNLSWPFSFV